MRRVRKERDQGWQAAATVVPYCRVITMESTMDDRLDPSAICEPDEIRTACIECIGKPYVQSSAGLP